MLSPRPRREERSQGLRASRPLSYNQRSRTVRARRIQGDVLPYRRPEDCMAHQAKLVLPAASPGYCFLRRRFDCILSALRQYFCILLGESRRISFKLIKLVVLHQEHCDFGRVIEQLQPFSVENKIAD